MISEKEVTALLSYEEYRKQTEDEIVRLEATDEKSTMLPYYKLNEVRMNRVTKTTKINTELEALIKSINTPWTWYVISEGWCGDAAQNVPVIEKMAALNDKITLKLILRDANLGLMDQYLTNGGRAIPKLICVDDKTKEEKGTWGPRPEPTQKMMQAYKAAGDTDYQKLVERMQLWYAKDRTATIQAEFAALISAWK